MRIGGKNRTLPTMVGAAVTAAVAVPVMANHSWGSYHWATTDNVVTIPVFDRTSGVWKNQSAFGDGNFVKVAVDDWNASPNIQSSLTTAAADPACPMFANEIHVCNGAYGNTGWVGIASISVSRGRSGHIVAGITKLNDYYFEQPYYNNHTWRQLVTCQEIGHDYGLGHQNENFSTDLTSSCMEYTNLPAGNEHPDGHDMEQLALIYNHDGSGGGTTDPAPGPGSKGGKKNLGVVGNGPSDWGQAVAFDAHGRANVFKRSTASYDIITHVTWAVGEGGGHSHDEAAPRRHSGERIFPGN